MRKIIGDKRQINRLSVDKFWRQKPINRHSVGKMLINNGAHRNFCNIFVCIFLYSTKKLFNRTFATSVTYINFINFKP